MPIEIRDLGARDAEAFQTLRLRGLREAPEAFGSSYEDELAAPLDAVAKRLEAAVTPTARVVLGAFAEGALVGVVGCYQETRPKVRHKATIWGMYVAPEARGRGVGRQLLDRVIAQARAWPNVERVALSVVERAAAARALYLSAGFRAFGREIDAFRQDGHSDTVEYLALDLSRPSGSST